MDVNQDGVIDRHEFQAHFGKLQASVSQSVIHAKSKRQQPISRERHLPKHTQQLGAYNPGPWPSEIATRAKTPTRQNTAGKQAKPITKIATKPGTKAVARGGPKGGSKG